MSDSWELCLPRIGGVDYESLVDGEGVRAAIFLSGCSHHCPGCHNSEAQDPNYGSLCTTTVLHEIAQQIAKRPFITGITLTGGDPLFCPQKTYRFLCRLSRCCKDIESIWLYTGYTFEQVLELTHTNTYCDLLLRFANMKVIVDGRFEMSLADKSLKFRGSSNQRIIDIKKSLIAERPILWEDNSI